MNNHYFFNAAHRKFSVAGRMIRHNYSPLPILDKSKKMQVTDEMENLKLEGEGVSRASERYMERTKKPFKDLQNMLSKDTSNKYISFGKL